MSGPGKRNDGNVVTAPQADSPSSAHVNFVAWFVLPFIAMTTIRIVLGVRPVRNGVALGLLTALQIFLGEELLLIGCCSSSSASCSWHRGGANCRHSSGRWRSGSVKGSP